MKCAINVQSRTHEMEIHTFMATEQKQEEEINVIQELPTDMQVQRQRPHQELLNVHAWKNNGIKEQIKSKQ